LINEKKVILGRYQKSRGKIMDKVMGLGTSVYISESCAFVCLFGYQVISVFGWLNPSNNMNHPSKYLYLLIYPCLCYL
jgi:hypothetical protein